MLEWLKLWWMFAPTDFWWFKANSVFSKATSKATPNMSVVERSATPKTDILASQNISTQANPSGIINSFAKTSTMLERQIEDNKKKVVMPTINPSMWFGSTNNIWGINAPAIGSQFAKPIWAEQTQLSNFSPEVKQSIAQEAQEVQQNIQNKWKDFARLWDIVKAKHPEYNDMDSADLGQKMLAKYPEYEDLTNTMTAETQNPMQEMAWWETIPYADPIKPYRWDETWAEYAWWLVANVPWSTWNIVAWLSNMVLNPIDTTKGIVKSVVWAGANVAKRGIGKITGETDEQINAKIYSEDNAVYTFFRDKLGIDMKENEEVGDAIWWFMVDRYWGWDNIKKTTKEDPVWVIGDVISVLQWWVGLAGKAWLINEATKVSMMAKLSSVDPYIQVPRLAVKWAVWALKITDKWLSNLADATMNKITAIDKEDRVFARQNPDLVNWYVNGTKTVDDVVQQIAQKMDDIQTNRQALGQEYETIRASGQTADTSKLIETLTPELSSKKIYITNDLTLKFDKFSKFNAPQQKAINEAWKIVQDAWTEGKLDVDQILNLRQKIDDLVNREWKSMKASGVDREAEALIKSFRKWIDAEAKTIKWLSELDSKYWPVLEEISTLKKDWFNTDGTLKDNALSKLKNLTNDANKARLTRLEQIMPWITNEIRWLKVWIAVDTAMKSRVAQYMQQTLMAWWWIAIFTNPALIVPIVAAGIALTPKNIIKTLQAIGIGQEWVNWVVNKIKGGTKLSTIEEARVGTLIKNNEAELPKIAQELPKEQKKLLSIERPYDVSSNNMNGDMNVIGKPKVEWLSNLWKTVKQPNVYSKGLGAKSKK